MKKIIYLSILSLLAYSACKKSKPVQVTTFDLARDSVFLYAKEDYYWSDGLPDYATFSPRSYSSSNDLSSLQAEVDALSQYKINPVTNQPYEYSASNPGHAKYSFIDQGQASTFLNGNTTDYGFGLSYYQTATDLRVIYVYPGSPAALANMHRGDLVTKINGSTALDGSVQANYNFIVSALNANTIAMTLQKADGTSYNVNITAGAYTVNPILTTKIIDQGGGKKVGYIAFIDFTALSTIKDNLDAIFSNFASNNVTDLVVDLRYNGGGFIETSEYLSNLIVPTAKSGTAMYTTYYNPLLTSGKAVLLKNQVRRNPKNNQLYNYSQINFTVANNVVAFAKAGVLNLNRVFFIVTGSTASASELTMNNLKPELNVQFIGRTTYGKPVGFFDINIDKYTMYIPEFETKNSAGQGGYYTGMTPGSADYPGVTDADDKSKDFGDPTELLFKHALDFVKNGTYAISGQQVLSTSHAANSITAAQSDMFTMRLARGKFNGMLFSKPFKQR